MSPLRPFPKSYPMARSPGLKILVWAGLAALLTSWLALTVIADEFGRLDGPLFFELAGGPDAHTHPHLTFRELEALPQVLRDERSALVIVKTDSNNLAKMLVSPGFRKLKPTEKAGPLVPVVVLERFETIDAGDHRSIKARGKELTLFDGFQIDLDLGQVVPPEMGGDIAFLTGAPLGPRLVALSGCHILTLMKPIPPPAPTAGKPTDGRVIVPADFAGRYSLLANGQWSGTLALAVDPAGAVSGHFRSDKNGTAYPVIGQVAVDVPQKIAFSVQFPRARQTYEGLLWTEGKNAIAGTVSMLDHPYGFIAVREGASLATESIDVALLAPDRKESEVRIVRLEPGLDRYTLDGQARAGPELVEILSKAVRADGATSALLRVPDSIPFERVRRAIEMIRGAGIRTVQLALSSDKGD